MTLPPAWPEIECTVLHGPTLEREDPSCKVFEDLSRKIPVQGATSFDGVPAKAIVLVTKDLVADYGGDPIAAARPPLAAAFEEWRRDNR